MVDFHGIIFAYSASPELGDLVQRRTAASLPFCSRYRLIDFALSSMSNAGIRDVGVIMQRDYQSLLDHLGSGKDWDLSHRAGGLRMLPPFGLPDYHRGQYAGTLEALNAVSSYIRDIQQKYVILMQGNICANIDLKAVMKAHIDSGAEITAICAEIAPSGEHHRYILDENGRVNEALYYTNDGSRGICSLGGYILTKEKLLSMMEDGRVHNGHYFHLDGIEKIRAEGSKIDTYIHREYVKIIRSASDYYNASMDMLDSTKRAMLFTNDRPVRTRSHEEVSTYYGEQSRCVNSLVGDNCIIEGSIENCIIFSGCRIAQGAELKNCIIMRGARIGQCSELSYIISDKFVEVSHGLTLCGSEKLPMVIPKGSKL